MADQEQTQTPEETAEDITDRLLRGKKAWRAGWRNLSEVQRTDLIEQFLDEIERFAMGNIEGRAISREEYEDDAATQAAFEDGEEN